MPFAIFNRRALAAANLTMLLFFPGMAALFFFVSLYLQQVLGYAPLSAGLAQLPLAVGIIISSAIASALVTRYGARTVLHTGLLLVAAALVWFAQISATGGYLTGVLGPSLVAAAGAGMVFVTLTILAMGHTAEHEAGLASGLISTSQQPGAALGLAVLAAAADATAARNSPAAGTAAGAGSPTALTEGFHAAFLGGAGFVLAALILAVLLTGRGRTQQQRPRTSAAPDHPETSPTTTGKTAVHPTGSLTRG